jgi:hypothetical protein
MSTLTPYKLGYADGFEEGAKRAVQGLDDAMVVRHLGVFNPGDDVKAAIDKIIKFEIDVHDYHAHYQNVYGDGLEDNSKADETMEERIARNAEHVAKEDARFKLIEECAQVADARSVMDIFEDHRNFSQATAREIANTIRALATKGAK